MSPVDIDRTEYLRASHDQLPAEPEMTVAEAARDAHELGDWAADWQARQGGAR